jgi:predicted HTH transcriptional regulator
MFLDGRNVGEGIIIDALQGAGYVTSWEIAAQSGRCHRQVLRHLSRLVKRRRVVKIYHDGIGGDRSTLYCLTDQRRAA